MLVRESLRCELGGLRFCRCDSERQGRCSCLSLGLGVAVDGRKGGIIWESRLVNATKTH